MRISKTKKRTIFHTFLLYNLSFNTIPFRPSWIAYLISFIVMMIVMILTFKLGLNRFRKQNIIETLKDDM